MFKLRLKLSAAKTRNPMRQSRLRPSRKNWVTLRHVNSGKQTEETKSYTEMLTASMRLSFSMSNVTPAKPIHEMTEAEFKFLMESYYQARMQRVS